MTQPPFQRAAALAPVTHGFFSRRGGVSTGLYDSLNCGVGSHDSPDLVAENRRRVVAALGGGGPLLTAHQHHSADAIAVSAPFDGDRPRGDALVTATPGLVIGVLTADCTPLLLADAEAGVVAAVHAGWRGARDGIVDAAITAMERLGARRTAIRGAIGPVITAPSYEVDSRFEADFLARDAGSARFFSAGRDEDHRQFDLPGYVADRLVQLGIAAPDGPLADTLTHRNYFSYRRSRQAGAEDYGRQVAAIRL
ncbi:peptidoglycan editing factor PgeF [Yunchengibacter salinarum]|uniref:peptidoglycan editing factor PgeF n=1 Tax=Yunchengibacter salinarum TaxID=3133399 RepID=UPI0035B630D5